MYTVHFCVSEAGWLSIFIPATNPVCFCKTFIFRHRLLKIKVIRIIRIRYSHICYFLIKTYQIVLDTILYIRKSILQLLYYNEGSIDTKVPHIFKKYYLIFIIHTRLRRYILFWNSDFFCSAYIQYRLQHRLYTVQCTLYNIVADFYQAYTVLSIYYTIYE